MLTTPKNPSSREASEKRAQDEAKEEEQSSEQLEKVGREVGAEQDRERTVQAHDRRWALLSGPIAEGAVARVGHWDS